MRFRAGEVEEHQSALLVEGERAPTEEVVQPHDHCLEPLVRPQAINAITVLFAEEQVPAPGFEREAPEHRLSELLGERNHDAGRPRSINRQGFVHVDTVDLCGGVSPPTGTQHHQAPVRVEGELDRAGNPGGHDIHAQPRRDVGACRRLGAHREKPGQPGAHEPCPPTSTAQAAGEP